MAEHVFLPDAADIMYSLLFFFPFLLRYLFSACQLPDIREKRFYQHKKKAKQMVCKRRRVDFKPRKKSIHNTRAFKYRKMLQQKKNHFIIERRQNTEEINIIIYGIINEKTCLQRIS